MKMDITIVTDVSGMDGEQRRKFIEGVLALFRETFPEAKPIPRKNVDDPSPVTVTIHTEDEQHED